VISVSYSDLLGVLPESMLVLTALLVIVVDAVKREAYSAIVPTLSIFGLAASAVAAISLWGQGGHIFSGMVIADGFTALFRVLFAVIGILTILLSPHYLSLRKMRLGEYYGLILIAIFGMMVMVSASNLLLFYLGLETMSITLYVLAGTQRADVKSAEAGMKYLVLGAFSSAFLLYGIALLYASLGTIEYGEITAYFIADSEPSLITVAGIGLLLVGFAFKVAAVPFHFWSPDVYDGSPTTITAFMSTGPKAAAFVGLIRVFGIMLAPATEIWHLAITVLAMITMCVGNVIAIRQTSVKRMLAYSSIAHAGYLLVGMAAGTKAAFAAMGYYLASYALMNIGAFAVIILLNRQSEKGSYHYDDLRGAGFAHPLLGATLTIFLLSLTGIPPTAGFFGKLYLFSSAVEQGHIGLVIVAVLNSAVAAFYYLRLITVLYMTKPEGEVITIAQPGAYKLALILSAVLILVIGAFPDQLLQVITLAVP
jgi:NADH-quinone oxidoreductase subunit N